MTPREKAKAFASAIEGKMGQDIAILEVTDLTILADFFIITTATSTTHLKTIADFCELEMKKRGETEGRIEGHASGSWVLMDYGSVVVPLFLKEARSFYSLERLWADAKQWKEADL